MFILCSTPFMMVACQSFQPREMNLNEYLQQFIGATSTEIQNNLDFKSLGYRISKDVEVSPQKLSYTILRPLHLPMPGGNTTIAPNAMGVPVIRYDTTATPSYDIHFNCKVTFILNHGIAQSIEYVGKAC